MDSNSLSKCERSACRFHDLGQGQPLARFIIAITSAFLLLRLQFGTGSLGATTSPEFDTRIGINQVTKPTVVPRLEFFVQAEPYLDSSLGRDREIHPCEVVAGAQAVLVPAEGSPPTISVSYVRRLYESPGTRKRYLESAS